MKVPDGTDLGKTRPHHRIYSNDTLSITVETSMYKGWVLWIGNITLKAGTSHTWLTARGSIELILYLLGDREHPPDTANYTEYSSSHLDIVEPFERVAARILLDNERLNIIKALTIGLLEDADLR